METVETGGDVQSLNDIQSYLANFNKEIGGGQTFILQTADGNVVTGGEQLYQDATIYQAQSTEDTKMKIEGQPGPQHIDPSMIAQPVGMVPTSIQAGTGAIFIQHAAGDGGMQVLASTAQASLAAAQAQASMAQTQEGQLVSVQASADGSQPQLVAVQRQAVNQSQMIAMQATQNSDGMVTVEENPSQVIAVQGDQGQAQQQVTVASTPTVAQGHSVQTSDGQSLVLGAGNAYQTVTIVPSEVNQGGEVSYVLIVSQPDADQDKDGNVDMSVYDFKEEARGFDDDDDDSPRKNIRATPKKPGGGTSTQLMCNYCNYTSPKRYLLTRHMKTHSEERPHKCHLCDRGFKTVASLQNHVNTHTGVRPHKCKECDAAFTTSGELVRHVRYRHTFEKPHKCTECDYASVELSKLKRHIRSHTGERPYQCPHCSYASPDTYKLKRHLRIHTGEKPYECDICHTRFTQSNSLKAHKLIHTGNKPVFQCELCPTACGRKTDLKIHVQKLHTSDRPLQCKKCGKSFPDRYTYKIHVKTHDGEKCFRCELCPYAALSQRHLESHILTHTGEKPYQCDECEQSFRQKQLLKRHKNLYHTPDYVPPAPREKVHQCAECQKTFAHRGNLLRHMLTHDPDNPEYLAAIKQEDIEGSELESEEEEDGGIEEGEIVQGTEGIHMANINGQQVQVQLVSVGDEDHPQVYIQIGDEQVGMVQAEEVEPGEPPEDGEVHGEPPEEEGEEPQDQEGVEEEPEIEPPGTPETPDTQGNLKMEGELEEGEVAYDLPKTPTRGRGRPPKAQSPKGTPTKTQEVLEEDGEIPEGELEEEVTPTRTRRNSKKRGADSVDSTPVKRPKRGTPKKEEGMCDDQKKKDIETCFGFGLDDDDIPPGEH